jgi:hypothetical protein
MICKIEKLFISIKKMENIIEVENTEGEKILIKLDNIYSFIRKKEYTEVCYGKIYLFININIEKFKDYFPYFIEIPKHNNKNIMIDPDKIDCFRKYDNGRINISLGINFTIDVFLSPNNIYENLKNFFDKNKYIEVNITNGVSAIIISYITHVYIDEDNIVTISFNDNSMLKTSNSYDEIKEKLAKPKDVKRALHKQ